MQIELDADVQRIAEQMQNTIPADKLVSVAESLSRLAPVLWGHHARAELVPLRMRADAPTA
jgi:hypothetical protein